jgi:hypothetical protein
VTTGFGCASRLKSLVEVEFPDATYIIGRVVRNLDESMRVR